MPRYDYECSDGHRFERTVPLKDAPGPREILCRVTVKGMLCGAMALRREVYAVHLGPGPTTPPR